MLRGKRPDSGLGMLPLPKGPRILLLRHDRIGDAIVSTPIISLLRERFPDGTIGVLLGRKNRVAAPLLCDVDMVHALESDPSGYLKISRELRLARYDVVINLLAKDSASGALLTTLSGAGFRIGFAGEASPVYDRVIEHSAEPRHIVSETSRLLEPLGIVPIGAEPGRDAERMRIRVRTADSDEGLIWWQKFAPREKSCRVVVNISAASPSRHWSDEATRGLLDRLRDEGRSVVVAADPKDRQRLESIVAPGGHKALPTTPSLAEYCAMLSHADYVITPDTAVVHLAAALRRPVVVLTNAGAAGGWYPWGVPHRLVCSADDTLGSIPLDPVAEAFTSLRIETERREGASPHI